MTRKLARFSLRTLFVVTTISCIAMGIYVNRLQRHKNAVVAIREHGGTFGVYIEGPKWLREMMDEESFYNACRVSLGPYNQGYDPNKPFGDAELSELIPHLNEFSALRTVDLSHSNVTDQGLVALRDLRNIESLRLNDTSISDRGLKFLEEIATLRMVSAKNTKVSEAGVKSFQLAVHNCKVEVNY